MKFGDLNPKIQEALRTHIVCDALWWSNNRQDNVYLKTLSPQRLRPTRLEFEDDQEVSASPGGWTVHYGHGCNTRFSVQRTFEERRARNALGL